jgi:hypothetical protein
VKQSGILKLSPICLHDIAEESFFPAIPMGMSGVWPVISVRLPALLIVFHCRLRKIKRGEGTPNSSGSISHGEEACPTYAIQLTPDFEMAEYNRQNMVYEKEHLLISGEGKYHGYNFYKNAGVEIGVKRKGEGDEEQPPVDVRSLMP